MPRACSLCLKLLLDKRTSWIAGLRRSTRYVVGFARKRLILGCSLKAGCPAAIANGTATLPATSGLSLRPVALGLARVDVDLDGHHDAYDGLGWHTARRYSLGTISFS